ncbi:MAG: hypothetical protein MZU97_14090 [Bacillus subtilis]|nr:hypothetical protein [Bacillus subtilis]
MNILILIIIAFAKRASTVRPRRSVRNRMLCRIRVKIYRLLQHILIKSKQQASDHRRFLLFFVFHYSRQYIDYLNHRLDDPYNSDTDILTYFPDRLLYF